MSIERKFIADEASNIEEKPLNDEEKQKFNKITKKAKNLGLQEDRIFSVSPDGSTEITGDNNLKLNEKK